MPVITVSLTPWNVRKKRNYRSTRCILAKPKTNTKNKQDPSPCHANVDAISLGIHMSIIEDMMPTPNSEDEGTSGGKKKKREPKPKLKRKAKTKDKNKNREENETRKSRIKH